MAKKINNYSFNIYAVAFFACLINLNFDGALKLLPLTILVLIVTITIAPQRIMLSKIEIFGLSILATVIFLKILLHGTDYSNPTSVEPFTPLLLFLLPIARYFSFKREKEFEIFFYLQLTIGFLDVALRLWSGGPQSFLDPELRFYSKVDGLYNNSNIAGQISSLLFTYTLISRFKKKYIGAFLVLAILSMSRTAWFTCIASILLFSIFNRKNLLNPAIKIKYLWPIMATAFVVINNFEAILNDYSYNTKILFLLSVLERYNSIDILSVVFGGALNSTYAVEMTDVENYSPHNPFLKVILYYGIFGLFSYLIFYVHCLKKGLSAIMLSGIVIQSFSGFPIISPILIFFLSNHGKNTNSLHTHPGSQR